MRNITIAIGVLVSILVAQVVLAQSSDGMIAYEMKINLHRRLPSGQEARKAMIPEFRTTKQQLFFNTDESFYVPVIEDEEEPMSGGGGFRMRTMQQNDEVYINPSSTSITSKREFMGKNYLINDTLKISPWKLGTETKEILGYVCKMAYYIDESQPGRTMEVTAWYTDKLRPMLGPEQYGSLPGAVLAVDINNGERVIVARKIELRPLKKNEMRIPVTGQKVTQAEYRKLVDEAMKQMGGSGGRMIIRN